MTNTEVFIISFLVYTILMLIMLGYDMDKLKKRIVELERKCNIRSM